MLVRETKEMSQILGLFEQEYSFLQTMSVHELRQLSSDLYTDACREPNIDAFIGMMRKIALIEIFLSI